MIGKIKNIPKDKDYGFISVPNSKDIFFHSRQVAKGYFLGDFLPGDEVEFEMKEVPKGLVGVDVRPAQTQNTTDEDLGI